MLKGIDPDFRHDDGVIVRGNGAVFGVVRCAKCPKCTPERCSGSCGVQKKCTPERCSGSCGVQKIQREGLSTRRRAW